MHHELQTLRCLDKLVDAICFKSGEDTTQNENLQPFNFSLILRSEIQNEKLTTRNGFVGWGIISFDRDKTGNPKLLLYTSNGGIFSCRCVPLSLMDLYQLAQKTNHLHHEYREKPRSGEYTELGSVSPLCRIYQGTRRDMFDLVIVDRYRQNARSNIKLQIIAEIHVNERHKNSVPSTSTQIQEMESQIKDNKNMEGTPTRGNPSEISLVHYTPSGSRVGRFDFNYHGEGSDILKKVKEESRKREEETYRISALAVPSAKDEFKYLRCMFQGNGCDIIFKQKKNETFVYLTIGGRLRHITKLTVHNVDLRGGETPCIDNFVDFVFSNDYSTVDDKPIDLGSIILPGPSLGDTGQSLTFYSYRDISDIKKISVEFTY